MRERGSRLGGAENRTADAERREGRRSRSDGRDRTDGASGPAPNGQTARGGSRGGGDRPARKYTAISRRVHIY